MNKCILYMACLIFFSGTVLASENPHHEHDNGNQSSVAATKNATNGTALAIAIGAQTFDWGTKDTQISIGTGSYRGSEALSLGVGRRVGRALISGSVASEGGSTGMGASITFHLK